MSGTGLPERLVEVRTIVSRADIRRYSELTHDPNPLHADPEAARRAGFRDVIAPGTMTLNLIWRMVARTFGPAHGRQMVLDARFVRPVYPEVALVAGGHLESERALYAVEVRSADGEVVIEGTLSPGVSMVEIMPAS